MSEAINMHKRMAMYGESEANHLKKGGKVKKYAKGGSVKNDSINGSDSGQPDEITHQKNVNKIGAYPESKVRNLPAKGVTPKITKAMPHSVATLKKGGMTKKPGLLIAIAVGKKASGRGR